MFSFSSVARHGALRVALALFTVGFAGSLVATPALRPVDLAALEARSLGPAVASGRVTAIAGAPGDPEVVWVGSAAGGVWKSVDGALTWTPVFDAVPSHSIGALAVDPNDPDIVWVGTGEGNPRNSVSAGNGVYRTRDGGRTWSHLGLTETRHIHRLRLAPDAPDTAWVAALGSPWIDSEQRGVFRTRDAGASWQRVLFVDPATGAADLDRAADGTLLAAMWQHRRSPWSFTSGGPGSGLYRSTDDGETWRRSGPEAGLPDGLLGRIGIAFAPSDPRIAYAFVEHDGPSHRLLRSEDGGATWTTVADSSTQPIGTRPFYYADLRVDPQDPDRVYSLWTALSVSEDGGRTWQTIAPFTSVHADHHALWIAPGDPTLLYDGNDGGVAVSRSRGETWRYVENLPLEQFYHVRVDDAVPYNVYGGTQDNGSWFGPSAVYEAAGIRAAHWREVGPGDGFDTVPIPGEPGRGYSMMPTGIVARFDVHTGESEVIRPEAPVGEAELRYGWDTPIELDPFDPDGLFLGSQGVHRTRDRGATWRRISPDLTTNRAIWQGFRETGGVTLDVSGAESFTTLSAIAASPRRRDLLWAGSDDGRLHVTSDGGTSWVRLDDALPEAPEHGRFTSIVASAADADVAYVTLEAHGFGDDAPYLYRTDDGGGTWTRLGRELDGWLHVVLEDPEEPRLLFAGTEQGLWLSIDRGATWQPFRAGLPRSVPVRDLAIQKREGALVIATHGRGLYVVDHLRPLRDLVELVASDAPAALTRTTPTIRHTRGRPPGARFPGDGELEAPNPPYGASFYLWLRTSIDSAPRITITSSRDGRVVRTLNGPSAAGLHRVVWDLRPDGPRLPNGQPISRFEVLPGRYAVRVQWAAAPTAADDGLPADSHGIVEVLPDPRLVAVPTADREARRATIEQALNLFDEVLGAVAQSQALRGRLDAMDDTLSIRPNADLQARLAELSDRFATLSARLMRPTDKHSRYPDRVFDEALKAIWVLEKSIRAPTPSQARYLDRAEAIARPFFTDLRRLRDDIDALETRIPTPSVDLSESAAEPDNR